MDPNERLMMVAWLFRLVGMVIGLAVIYMGMQLFRRPRSAGNVGTFGANLPGVGSIKLEGAAGTFLVVAGTVIMLGVLYKSITWRREETVGLPPSAADSVTPVLISPSDREAPPPPGNAEPRKVGPKPVAPAPPVPSVIVEEWAPYRQESVTTHVAAPMLDTPPRETSRRVIEEFAPDTALMAPVQ
jgi:hypothetical protein